MVTEAPSSGAWRRSALRVHGVGRDGIGMGYDLLIVSDIHLTDGRAPAAGADHLVPELVRFLERHQHHPEAGRRWRLVVNGDAFDFLHVQLLRGEEVPFSLSRGERARGPHTSPEKSLWRLRKILSANGPFLEALGGFLRAGNEVVFLPGNHDMELYWEQIQTEVRAALRPAAGNEGLARLSFKPWCYHEPGVLYVEHGSQLDADNRVFRWMAPEVPERPDVLELAAGQIVNRYFTHRLGLGPFVGDTSQSALGYALWMVKQFGVWRYFQLFGWYLAFCAKVVGWAGRRSPARAEADAEHARRRAQVERTEGLPEGSLAAMEAAAPAPVMSTRWRMLQRTMLPRVVVGTATVAAALLMLLLGGVNATTVTLSALVVGLPLTIFTLGNRKYTGVADRYYPAGAEAIRRAAGVRYVAFGHQHIARAERPEEGERRYINLGCWVEGQGFEKVPLHYLEVRLGPEPQAELKRWNGKPAAKQDSSSTRAAA